MTVAIENLQRDLVGRVLPGTTIVIDRLESHAVDVAARAESVDATYAHPVWFVILGLRGMGISVDELGDLAQKSGEDALLFGGVAVDQAEPLRVGDVVRSSAVIVEVGRSRLKDGGNLDRVVVTTTLRGESDVFFGATTSTYLFKRAMVTP